MLKLGVTRRAWGFEREVARLAPNGRTESYGSS